MKECTLEHILPDNKAMIDVVIRAARRTTNEIPIVSLPAREHELIMTQILNSISQMVAPNFFLQDRYGTVDGV